MERLSEIGTEEQVSTLLATGATYWSEDAPDDTVIILTPDERRELVREALKQWEHDAHGMTGPPAAIEEFIKEQGL